MQEKYFVFMSDCCQIARCSSSYRLCFAGKIRNILKTLHHVLVESFKLRSNLQANFITFKLQLKSRLRNKKKKSYGKSHGTRDLLTKCESIQQRLSNNLPTHCFQLILSGTFIGPFSSTFDGSLKPQFTAKSGAKKSPKKLAQPNLLLQLLPAMQEFLMIMNLLLLLFRRQLWSTHHEI